MSEILEPRTGKTVGVWFENQECWGYHGLLPVVMQFHKTWQSTEPMVVSRCPPCERRTLEATHPGRKVKRWMIIPP